MKRLTISRARELIKRELGISATALAAPPDMNENPDYQWYEMHSGTQRIEVYTEDVQQGKYTNRMIALNITHENSLKGATEYFYRDTLDYAAPYTEWQNREAFCETMEDPNKDAMLHRLKREAFNGCRRHFHKPTRQQNRVSQQDTEIDAHPLEEISKPNNFQGKLKIRIFDLHETFIHDTDPFDETKLNWWVDLETKHINDSLSFSGLTVFQWDHESKKVDAISSRWSP